MGSGRFVAPKTFEVRLMTGGTRVLAADQIFLNLGTQATIPIPGPQGCDSALPISKRWSSTACLHI